MSASILISSSNCVIAGSLSCIGWTGPIMCFCQNLMWLLLHLEALLVTYPLFVIKSLSHATTTRCSIFYFVIILMWNNILSDCVFAAVSKKQMYLGAHSKQIIEVYNAAGNKQHELRVNFYVECHSMHVSAVNTERTIPPHYVKLTKLLVIIVYVCVCMCVRMYIRMYVSLQNFICSK